LTSAKPTTGGTRAINGPRRYRRVSHSRGKPIAQKAEEYENLAVCSGIWGIPDKELYRTLGAPAKTLNGGDRALYAYNNGLEVGVKGGAVFAITAENRNYHTQAQESQDWLTVGAPLLHVRAVMGSPACDVGAQGQGPEWLNYRGINFISATNGVVTSIAIAEGTDC
jgi:hypothetical protein